jgi:hypothetical protein
VTIDLASKLREVAGFLDILIVEGAIESIHTGLGRRS